MAVTRAPGTLLAAPPLNKHLVSSDALETDTLPERRVPENYIRGAGSQA